MNRRKADVVIIGSGLAGLMTADYLCNEKNVMLITKSEINHSNSWLAQGGIAAAVTKEDHWHEHYQDTIVAGSFHNRKETTEILVKHGTRLIKRLIEIGVNFDKDENNELSLGMEGAHGKRRILHAGGDATGKVIVEAIMARVLPRITVFEREMAYDLVIENGVCCGVYTKDENDNIWLIEAEHVIVATGGIGQLYSATSNCLEATGDGIAMAYRAGAAISDMEFIQFHPTLFKCEGSGNGLISEAVRGEGARLVTGDGEFLMKGKHPMEDLAPRDIVAREIFQTQLKNKSIFLNIQSVRNFQSRFPSIYEMCRIDPTFLKNGLLPVQPGAHFIMGGIKVDEDGCSTIPNLYAVGECANTGVHGANRLASNSLLEAVVFAERLSGKILTTENKVGQNEIAPVVLKSMKIVTLPTIKDIQMVMDRYVGIIRDAEGLQQAITWFEYYLNVLDEQHFQLNIQEKIICNMLTVGLLVAKASLHRKESRGGHYRSDFPKLNDHEWYGYRNVFLKKELYQEKFIEQSVMIS
ncbi:L-aspartate oxidase [Anaerobacillus sp. CMMVII]|uniref:L-aspartate oxidase n=1 Tax=Anaerobacillus sp. CMMVII TaxID=2755588 RepID=UPI0021B836D8|nr:L-aspartate oxidase [Anaerobacillus sp. CMMVII]MCT8139524.1 L-aspartate oxidase [Anaerobacillus sp. CMMVII]